MSFNLLRNSRVFFTTAVGTSGADLGVIGATSAPALDATNTREIQVLDGFGFSQNTTSETVTLSETGQTPVRGQRSFNTQLDPVDFNMTTYIRPAKDGTAITAEESVLWNALFGVDPIGGTAPAWANGTAAVAANPTATPPVAGSAATAALCTANNSNKHQLQRFGLIVIIDTACFLIDDCVLNTATLDFGIDAIASIQWAGQAKAIRQVAGPATIGSGSFTGTGIFNAAAFTQKTTTAAFIANKLSVITLQKNLDGTGSSTNPYYNVPLTGGNLTISNNVSYLTPATLGIVNQPVTYFTGTRGVSGSLTAYLRTGAGQNGSTNNVSTTPAGTDARTTAQLLSDLLASSTTDVDPAYRMSIAIGGTSATDRVELEMPGVVLTIPTIATEQVISTTINFTAQGTSGSGSSTVFDLAATNELKVRYYA
jgi:hypothetical protein